MEAARTMFLARNVSKELWAEAIGYAVYIQNRTLSSTGDATPFELVYGYKPDVSNLRVFGSPAFVHIPDARRRKLDPKALEGIFVGCCPFTKAYRVWIESDRRIQISRNVVIDESNQMPQYEAEQPLTHLVTPFDSFLPEKDMVIFFFKSKTNIFFILTKELHPYIDLKILAGWRCTAGQHETVDSRTC